MVKAMLLLSLMVVAVLMVNINSFVSSSSGSDGGRKEGRYRYFRCMCIVSKCHKHTTQHVVAVGPAAGENPSIISEVGLPHNSKSGRSLKSYPYRHIVLYSTIVPIAIATCFQESFNFGFNGDGRFGGESIAVLSNSTRTSTSTRCIRREQRWRCKCPCSRASAPAPTRHLLLNQRALVRLPLRTNFGMHLPPAFLTTQHPFHFLHRIPLIHLDALAHQFERFTHHRTTN
mmetsp:Transcript_23921/g.43746  ORF Transcript_23921/g.43746 Transcript_23921/m.43746 type:complete len:230 (-) Transcript_23921:486-1175(-)